MPTEKELWVHFAEECEALRRVIDRQQAEIETYKRLAETYKEMFVGAIMEREDDTE